MKCEEFRIAVGAEPDSVRADLAAHAANCAHCAAYRGELQEMDRAIFRALNVDVTPRAHPSRAIARQRPWRLAAGLLIAIITAASIWVAAPRQSFAEQIVAHVREEPKSLLRTLDVVSPDALATVLTKSGVRLGAGTDRISYAMSCWFRGQFVPHLVVQTAEGPVTVLIMPRERTPGRPQRLAEGGVEGIIVPAPRGVLVVLGDGASAEQVARAMLGTLEYDA